MFFLPSRSSTALSGNTSRAGDDGALVRTFPGVVRFGVGDPWEIVGAANFDVLAGSNLVRLHVRRRTMLALMDESARPLSESLLSRVQLRSLDGGGAAYLDPSESTWHLDRPGRWLVELRGGEPASFEVDLAVGPYVQRQVHFTRHE